MRRDASTYLPPTRRRSPRCSRQSVSRAQRRPCILQVREKPRNNRQKHAKKTFAHHTSDARFEVIGTPFSLLSVSLSASQTLYTRRGTLVGLSGKSENTLSTLSFLEPLQRAPVGHSSTRKCLPRAPSPRSSPQSRPYRASSRSTWMEETTGSSVRGRHCLRGLVIL